jgi:hypothetical protein
MKAFTIALATALLATGGAATAQTASDAQCIVLSNAYAGQAKDAQAKELAEASLYFYLGRVGNMTAAQLKTMLDAQAKALTPATAGPAMNKCAEVIQSKVDMLKSFAAPAQATPAKPAQPGR